MDQFEGKSLFGTDGIRGKANYYPINSQIAMQAGYAIGEFVKAKNKKFLIIGRDTRISGAMLESALAAGAASVGINVLLAGIIPTPAVACICSHIEDVGAGVVISASHNPYDDNGIKFFDENGYKLNTLEELSIEEKILSKKDYGQCEQIGTIQVLSEARQIYHDFLLKPFCFEKEKEFQGKAISVVIDGANGAASPLINKVFSKDCFVTFIINDKPDGYNINENCGSQHIDSLKKYVIEKKADIGLAFDGDADRLIAVDEKGNQVGGDVILAICAYHAMQKRKIDNPVVVSTIMSNMGLSDFFESMGLSHVKTRVGDKNVLQGMQESGAVLGGEDSGHLIFGDYHTTGDGMFCALKLVDILFDTQKPLSELARIMTVYPQELLNIEIKDPSRPDVTKIPEIARVIDQVKENLAGQGRVLIRYSGTQPLLRVMVEGPCESTTKSFCQQICQAVEKYFK